MWVIHSGERVSRALNVSVYTTVTPDELSAWLGELQRRHAARPERHLRRHREHQLFVYTTAGRYVLTLFEKLTAAELPFYLDLMAHLADHGIPERPSAARPLGRAARRAERQARGARVFPAGQGCRAAGARALRRGRRDARAHPPRRRVVPAAAWRIPRGLSWWQAVMPEILRFLRADDAALLREEVRVPVRAAAVDDLPRGAIHADLFRDNALFEGDAHLRRHRLLFRVHRRAALRRRDLRERLVRDDRRARSTTGARGRCSRPTRDSRPFTPSRARRVAGDAARRRRCVSGFRGSTTFTCRGRASSRTPKTRRISGASWSSTSRRTHGCRLAGA